jgi:hypothetical protein
VAPAPRLVRHPVIDFPEPAGAEKRAASSPGTCRSHCEVSRACNGRRRGGRPFQNAEFSGFPSLGVLPTPRELSHTTVAQVLHWIANELAPC